MISNNTISEIANCLNDFSKLDIERIYILFNLGHLLYPADDSISTKKRINTLVEFMKSTRPGPSSKYFAMDLLKYVVDQNYNSKVASDRAAIFSSNENFEESFSKRYPLLVNSLKRDGYIIKGSAVIKLLPNEIVEANTESELVRLLEKFHFETSKAHLREAIANHTSGQWSSANSQFRTYVESVLVDISNKLLPKNTCTAASTAIKLLSETANPPFLKKELNEVDKEKGDLGYVTALFKRLHPQGSHPGIPDDYDCTFRYHTVIVFSYYLLHRLEQWP
jgi:hypothetical protein